MIAWVAQLHEDGYSDNTVASIFAIFSTLMNGAVHKGGHPTASAGQPLRRANFRQRFRRPTWDGIVW
jgi:hypothetical protein